MISNPSVREAIENFKQWGGVSFLPIAPKLIQSTNKKGEAIYPKCPSWLDRNGNRHKIDCVSDALKTPTLESELEMWFANPSNGLGVSSGSGGVWWLDIDRKYFASQEECDREVREWLDRIEAKGFYIEKTGSGGYHIPVRCSQKPPFYELALTDGGKRIGEILSGFVVVAPTTLDRDGETLRYEVLRGGNPLEINSWAEIPIFNAAPSKPVSATPKPFVPREYSGDRPLDDFALAEEILGFLPPDLADDLNVWLAVGGALWSLNDPRALQLWEDWSSQSPKFRKGECRWRWKSLKYGHIGTLVNIAKKHGWQPPKRKFEPLSAEAKQAKEDYDFKRWLKLRKYTPDRDISQRDSRFVNIPEDVLKSNQCFVVKSGLGTGKTQAQGRIRDVSGKGSRSIGSRNSLEVQSAERLSANGRNHYHVRFDDGYHFLSDKDSHLHGAIDTMAISGTSADVSEVDIFLDEISQLLEHTVGGVTLGSNQIYAMRNFAEMLKESSRNMAFDGNLKDYEVEFLEAVSGRDFLKLENKVEPIAKTYTFVDGVGEELEEINEDDEKLEIFKSDLSAILRLLFHPNKNSFIVTDSINKACSIQKMAIKAGIERVFVVSSETQDEPWARDFLKNPSNWIKENRPQMLIGTPVIQSGIDINAIIDESWEGCDRAIGSSWFDFGFALFSGVLLLDGLAQILNRLRDVIPWFISCPGRGLPVPRYYPKSYKPDEVKKQAEAYVEFDIELLAQSEVDAQKMEAIRRLARDLRDRADDKWWQLFCTIIAQQNYERDNLRKCLEFHLKNGGHSVERLLERRADQLKTGFKEAKDERLNEVAAEIVAAPLETDEQIEKRKRKATKSKEDDRIISRHYIDKVLPGIGESDLWEKVVTVGQDKEGNAIEKAFEFKDFTRDYFVKRSDYLSGLERFYLLQNFEIATKRSDKRFFGFLNNLAGQEFMGRILGNPYLVLWALEQLGINRLLEGEHGGGFGVFEEMFERGKSDPEIAIALGFTPAKLKPDARDCEVHKAQSEYAQRLCQLAGIPLKCHRKRVNGKATRVYRLNAEKMSHPYRTEALKRIGDRWQQWSFDNQAIKWEKVLEVEVAEECEVVFALEDEAIEMPSDELAMLEDEARSQPPEFAEQCCEDIFMDELSKAMDHQRIPVVSDVESEVIFDAESDVDAVLFISAAKARMAESEFIAIRNKYGASLGTIFGEKAIAFAAELRALQIA